ncbi:hypothetical protein ACS0TY_015067 [Phlomoides rotata]
MFEDGTTLGHLPQYAPSHQVSGKSRDYQIGWLTQSKNLGATTPISREIQDLIYIIQLTWTHVNLLEVQVSDMCQSPKAHELRTCHASILISFDQAFMVFAHLFHAPLHDGRRLLIVFILFVVLTDQKKVGRLLLGHTGYQVGFLVG